MATRTAPSSEKRDVARFLEAHESCASDFDIRRAAGVGDADLKLICNGCGERASYGLGGAGVLEATDRGPDMPARLPRRQRARRGLTREQVERWLPAPPALPWWVPNAYILAVVVVGLGMIAFGVINRDEGDPARFGGGATEIAPDQPGLAPPPGGGPPAPASVAPAAGSGSEPEPAKPRRRPALDRVTVLGRFSIGVPRGWRPELSGGAVAVRPGDDAGAELRVFLEPGGEGPRSLGRKARRFLDGRHPGAAISGPRPLRLGGERAIWHEARFGRGLERAVTLSVSGYEYLLLARVDAAAPGRLERQAAAALKSFEAL